MARAVGLSRNLKLSWLNKAADLASYRLTEQEVKEQLNEYLSYEINSPTNLRKTREILMNIWVYPLEETKEEFRNELLKLFMTYPEYRLQIHWCMLMITYPIFVDVAKIIGKLSEFDDEFTTGTIKEKIYDEWGERTTLFHSLDKLISTLKELPVIDTIKAGRYTIHKQKTDNAQIVNSLIYAIMITKGSYIFISDIQNINELFPFDISYSKEQLMNDNRFVISNFDSKLCLSLA